MHKHCTNQSPREIYFQILCVFMYKGQTQLNTLKMQLGRSGGRLHSADNVSQRPLTLEGKKYESSPCTSAADTVRRSTVAFIATLTVPAGYSAPHKVTFCGFYFIPSLRLGPELRNLALAPHVPGAGSFLGAEKERGIRLSQCNQEQQTWWRKPF